MQQPLIVYNKFALTDNKNEFTEYSYSKLNVRK